jgi:glycosyltransferase involved in cell wall biosynthesis
MLDSHGRRDNPLVSAVIPAYNYGVFIMDAVESVLAQTYENIEIIVVDDGSTDNTGELLKPYEEAGKLRYIYQKNAGNASARNLGITSATGEFIAFLDADDIWLENKIERQMSFLDEHPEHSAVFCDEFFFRDGEEPVKAPPKILENEDFFEKFLLTCYTTPSSLLIRRSAFELTGLFNTKLVYCEDWDLMIRITKHVRVGYLPEYLLMKREHNSSMSAKYLHRAFNYKELYYNNTNLLDKRQLRMFRRVTASKCWRRAQRLMSDGKTKEAFSLFSFIAKISPAHILKFPSLMKRYFLQAAGIR